MREIKRIVIHCADTPNGKWFDSEDILNWHTRPKPKGNGWSRSGYHFVVPIDGEVEDLVKLDDDKFIEPWEVSYGARGFNKDSIHICLIGRDKFTSEQWESLHDLAMYLRHKYEVDESQIVGHTDLDSHKTCPNFDVQHWWAYGADEKHILRAE